MTHPRNAFGVLAGRAGPEAQLFGKRQRHAACVRPQPIKGVTPVARQSRIHGVCLSAPDAVES